MARVFLPRAGMPIGLLVLVAAAYYFSTPDERARAFRACVRAARQVASAAAVCRLAPDDPFYLALRQRARYPFVTYAIVAVNVGLFGAMLLAGGSLNDPDTLVAWGANFAPRTTSGERWRLLTAVFVHAGIIHAFVNIAVLAQLGLIVERAVGHLTFLVVYLTAGVLGSIMVLPGSPTTVLVGGTAAVAGAYGLLLAASVRGLLQSSALRIPLRVLKTLAPAAVIFVLYYLATEGDYTKAKVGLCTGLVGGIVLTRVVLDPKVRIRRFAALTAATAVIVLMAAMAVQVVRDIRPDVAAVIRVEDETARQYADAVVRFRNGGTTMRGLVEVIEQRIVPNLQAALNRVSALDHVPPRDQQLLTSTEEYLRLRQESWRVRAAALRNPNMRKLREADRTEQVSLQAFDKVKAAYVAQ